MPSIPKMTEKAESLPFFTVDLYNGNPISILLTGFDSPRSIYAAVRIRSSCLHFLNFLRLLAEILQGKR